MLKNVSEGATTPEDIEPGKGVQEDGRYFLTEIQAQAVLDMRLNRLTGMEREKLIEEYRGIISDISELISILSSSEKLLEIIREELVLVQKEYGDERRTEIVDVEEDLTAEDLIPEQDVVVTFSNGGYAKDARSFSFNRISLSIWSIALRICSKRLSSVPEFFIRLHPSSLFTIIFYKQ